MELTIPVICTIISVIFCVATFVTNRMDKAKNAVKENHQELIEYQLKELKDDYKNIASDIKDIKKMLDTYKETFRTMVRDEMTEHIKIYHSKEN